MIGTSHSHWNSMAAKKAVYKDYMMLRLKNVKLSLVCVGLTNEAMSLLWNFRTWLMKFFYLYPAAAAWYYELIGSYLVCCEE